GWAKWNRGPAAFAELLKQANVPLPLANAWLVTLLEIFGANHHSGTSPNPFHRRLTHYAKSAIFLTDRECPLGGHRAHLVPRPSRIDLMSLNPLSAQSFEISCVQLIHERFLHSFGADPERTAVRSDGIYSRVCDQRTCRR